MTRLLPGIIGSSRAKLFEWARVTSPGRRVVRGPTFVGGVNGVKRLDGIR